MRKPNDLSVTDVPCRCGSLERDARDSGLPIRYDLQCNEYYFEFTLPKSTKLSLVIYHCPMCGGVASESKRDSAFVALSEEEALRVGALVRDLETMDEIVSKLGAPDCQPFRCRDGRRQSDLQLDQSRTRRRKER